MAGGAVVSTGPVKVYPGKMTPYVLFICFVAASGGLIFGYDIGISGIYLKRYQYRYGNLIKFLSLFLSFMMWCCDGRWSHFNASFSKEIFSFCVS